MRYFKISHYKKLLEIYLVVIGIVVLIQILRKSLTTEIGEHKLIQNHRVIPNSDEKPTITMWIKLNTVRRLGNLLLEYASLRGIAVKNNMTAILPPIYRNLVEDFPNIILPIDDEETANERRGKYHVVPSAGMDNIRAWNLSKENIILAGYFHNGLLWRYLDMELRRELQFSDRVAAMASAFLTTHKAIEIANNDDVIFVGIHVRRTDFIKQKTWKLTMGNQAYFKNAMKYYARTFANVIFVVCSDDMEWCKQYITGRNVVYSEGHSAVEDLAILSSCNHTIVSCTFSSFGRFASWYANGTAVAPINRDSKPPKYDWMKWKFIPNF